MTFLTAIACPTSGGDVPRPTCGPAWASTRWSACCWASSAWGVYAGLLYAVPPLVAAALVIVALELVTRALHLDGLMDTADGYLSGAPRERALEIMKDSQVGAMGVFAAVRDRPEGRALAALARADAALRLIAGLSAARPLPALDVRYFAYARREGTGAAFTGASTRTARCVAAAACRRRRPRRRRRGSGGAGGAVPGASPAAAAVAVALGVQALVARSLGGLTGDVYGLGIELAEAACALASAP